MQNSASKRPQAKHWAGCTINNWTEFDLACFQLAKPELDYFVYGKEVGEKGTPHLQFMLCFKKTKLLTTVSKMFPNAHLEIKSAKSTMKEASDYCKKDGDFEEFGTLPLDQKVAGLKVIADKYKDTVEKAKVGDFENINAEHQLRYYKTIKQIAHDHKVMPKDLTWNEGDQPNIWIWGPTRTGKSYKARQICGSDVYLKNAANKWWDKYNGQKNVLIEDIDKSHSYQGFYLKIWADKYAFPVEIKTSGDLIRPSVIVVTSNYKIEDVFPDPSIHKPLLERFKIIHMEHRWDATINDVLKKDQPLEKGRKRKAPTTEGQKPLKRPALYRLDATGNLQPNTMRQLLVDASVKKIKQPVVLSSESSSSSSSEDEIEIEESPKTIDLRSMSSEESYHSLSDGECKICGELNIHLVDGRCRFCWNLSNSQINEDSYNLSNDEDDLNIIEEY